MENDVVLALGLPVMLGIIMLGLGLSLSLLDFHRTLADPKPFLIAITCQMIVLPLACAGIASIFGLAPAFAVGLMLLAATPGGTMSNLFSYLAGGDVALNITLTAVSSVLSILTLPLIVNVSMLHFMGAHTALPLPVGKVLQVMLVVLVPVAMGMYFRRRFPQRASLLAKRVKLLSVVILISLIVSTAIRQRGLFAADVLVVVAAVLTFNLLSLAVGYGVPRVLGVRDAQARAISMEIGLHNAALAIAIALSPTMLDNPLLAIPAAIYGVLSYVPAGALCSILARRNPTTIAAS